MPTGQRVAVVRRRGREGRRGMRPVLPAAAPGRPVAMLTKTIHDAGLRGWYFHAASLGSIGLCVGLWIRAKTVDQEERGNAERRALFVGLCPRMFWLIGDGVQRYE